MKSKVQSLKSKVALLSAFCILHSAFASDAVFHNAAVTNRLVIMTPLILTPGPGQTAVYDRIPFVTDATGTYTVPNCTAGTWQVAVQGPPDLTVFAILVSSNSGPEYMEQITVAMPKLVARPQDYPYSASASDGRYAKIGSGGLSYLPQPASPWLTNWSAINPGTMASLAATTNAAAGLIALIPPSTDTNAVNTIVNSSSNSISSAFKSQLSSLSPPFATVYTNGTFTGGGAFFDVSSTTTTCGIQEALDWGLQGTNNYRSGGVVIYISPGTHYTHTPIMIPGTHFGTNLISVTFLGAGKISSGITYLGPTTNVVIMVNPTNSRANFSALQDHGPDTVTFVMRDMFVSSMVNGCTNIVLIKCPSPSSAMHWGSIESVTIDHCMFFYGDLTNTTWVQSQIPRTQENLIAIGIDTSFGDQVIIRDCSFISCLGISWACDWGCIERCIFESASGAAYTNAWPHTSPYYLGASITFRSASDVQLDSNLRYITGGLGGHQWTISHNEFVGVALPYFSYLPLEPGWSKSERVLVYNDSVEIDDVFQILATTGNGVTFVDCKIHGQGGAYPPIGNYGAGYEHLTGYVLTNFTDFSYWKNVPISSVPTNTMLFNSVDSNFGTNSGPYTFLDNVYGKAFFDLSGNPIAGSGGLTTNDLAAYNGWDGYSSNWVTTSGTIIVSNQYCVRCSWTNGAALVTNFAGLWAVSQTNGIITTWTNGVATVLGAGGGDAYLSGYNTWSQNQVFEEGVQFDATVTLQQDLWTARRGRFGSSGATDPTNQFEVVASGGTFKVGTNGVMYGNASGLSIPVASSNQFMGYGIGVWGDSLTTDYDSPGNGLAAAIQNVLPDKSIFDGGVAGDTSILIKTRMLADTKRNGMPTVIWAGVNDINRGDFTNTVTTNIAAMVANLTTTNYLILGVLVPTNYPGLSDTNHQQVHYLNASLAAKYPGHFFDVHSYLVSNYNASLPQDVIDYGNHVQPDSLRQPNDGVHLNQAGSLLAAQPVAWWVSTNWDLQISTIPLPNNGIADIGINPPVMSFERIAGDLTLVGTLKDGANLGNLRVNKGAGQYCTNKNNQFIGSYAGQRATNANQSIMVGPNAGRYATYATNVGMFGPNAGEYATSAHDSFFWGNNTGQNATNASYSIFLGSLSGQNAWNASYANFIGYMAGGNASDALYSVFGGWLSGYGASNASYSVFEGALAGEYATFASNSIIQGPYAGQYAVNAYRASIQGYYAGQYGTNAHHSVFNGPYAGQYASGASSSSFIGGYAGQYGTNAHHSLFWGYGAGQYVNRANTLIIDSQSTATDTNAFVYGEMDNKMLRINGTLNVRTNITIGSNSAVVLDDSGGVKLTNITFSDGTVLTTAIPASSTTNFCALTNLLGGTLTALSINFNYGSAEADWKTNGVVTFGGYINLSSTNYCHALIHLTGGSGSATAVAFPANTHVYGTANLTNSTDVLLNYMPEIPRTNALCVPLD